MQMSREQGVRSRGPKSKDESVITSVDMACNDLICEGGRGDGEIMVSRNVRQARSQWRPNDK